MKHISPTDVTQYVRFEKCERYLYFRLHKDIVDGQSIFADGVVPERIPPLLTLMGGIFEGKVEYEVSQRYRVDNLSKIPKEDGVATLLSKITELTAGSVVFLFQVGLVVEVDGWQMTGAIDILRLRRDRRGRLKVMVVDMKSSGNVRVEYRLQVAFYKKMLQQLFHDAGLDCASITTAILYRGQRDYTEVKDTEELRRLKRHRRTALKVMGVADAFLEIIKDGEVYLQEVEDMVTAPDSTAHRLLNSRLEDLHFCLTYKCDTCFYNNYCMKWSAERQDLALLPFLNINDRKSLISSGIETIPQLGALKRLTDDGVLETESGCEETVREISRKWGIGGRLDELIHRAKVWMHRRDPAVKALGWIPDKGYSSLPHIDAQLNSNLVQVYMDAQNDYHYDRVFMLGALVVAHAAGKPVRRNLIVELTDGPPDTAEKERRLYVRWVNAVLRSIVELAEPDAEGGAPIHIVFYDRWEQRLLLDGLARNFSGVLGATPLYDFMTQIAAYDSPVATFLNEEIRKFTNYPMVCQSLQSVATYLGYDWNAVKDYTRIFYHRLFDFAGQLTHANGEVEWYSARSRFSSLIPLEYVYAAWNCLPETDNAFVGSSIDRFKGVKVEDLVGFEGVRLGAIEYIAKQLKTNKYSEKKSFKLPSLVHFENRARNFAEALKEFLAIERHVELADWKAIHHIEPERRVLMGETLLASYHEEDQEREVVEKLRANLLKYREQCQIRRARGQAGFEPELTAEEKRATKWSNEGLRVRLRLTAEGLDCTLDDAMLLNNLEEGDRVVVYSRYTVDERLPVEEQVEHTPTPRQLLYGSRAELSQIVLEREDGQVVSGYLDLTMCRSSFTSEGRYCFASIEKPFQEGEVYTLDSDPNDIYGYWCAKTVEALCKAEADGLPSLNTLYSRICSDTQRQISWSARAQAAQERFMYGLEAFAEAGLLHDFEPAKRAYIAKHGADSLLLVQGPPGTGKSYSTAFAVLARMQGAMSEDRDYLVTLSCKTHAATDVLIRSLRNGLEELQRLHAANARLFADYFDARLLNIPLFRVYGRDELGDGVTMISKSESAAKVFKQLSSARWAVVAATPGSIYKIVYDKISKKQYSPLGYYFTDCLVLDEASQMNLPEACMAALGLRPEGQLIVVGDHRQMPPIVHHDWDSEPRRTFQEYQSFRSLFWMLQAMGVPMIKFTRSFRLHETMARFLRDEVYIQDGINYYSERKYLLESAEYEDDFVSAVLRSDYPLVVVVHDESSSQTQNLYELNLVKPILESLNTHHGLSAEAGLGVVVPHRLQRAVMRRDIPCLVQNGQGKTISAVDTVERFQGDERDVIVVSATESDPQFVQACSRFLLDPRRLTVALSRARKKMVLVASRSIFQMFESDEETFKNLCMWKNLLRRVCKETLWEGEREGCWVQVKGARV